MVIAGTWTLCESEDPPLSTSKSRYSAEIDLGAVNDTHVLAIGRVPANCRVLDLGLADGSVAGVLGEMGCRVSGVELDPFAADAARSVCKGEVVVGDLNNFDFAEEFNGEHFDVVLMLDILEHLSNPAAVLKRLAPVLAEGGWGVISLPNIAHVSTRLALLEGHFTYTDLGLLDRTHLRFFDRDGVDDLLNEAGWEMFDMVRVTRRLGTTEIQLDHADKDLVREIESDIEGLTYQFVISVAPSGSSVLEHPPVLPAAIAHRAMLEATAHIEGLNEELCKLRDVHLPDLMEQLTAIRGSSVARRGHLKHVLAAVQENSQRLHDSLSNP
jgi:2-polyprenyl-3-methyl-5-hydroxy-6-metoxy-1,4-benzoquinol methylase